MNWGKINVIAILEVLREMEEESLTVNAEHSIIYSDGFEELKIIYKKLEQRKVGVKRK